MNLLFISNNSNAVDGGLNWSVPASVKAQQAYDNVLWVDLTHGAFQKHWAEVEAYHNISDFGGKISLSVLPSPFNHPDFVLFEGFYYLQQVRFSNEIKKKGIPYIIIPRGSLTARAFHNGGVLKYLKKKLAHFFIFNKFIRGAKLIQYLTRDEYLESSKHFKTPSFILSNGFKTPLYIKQDFSKSIRAVFVGRQDINQKGLDLLFGAIAEIHDDLKVNNFQLDVYGPPRYDYKKVTELINKLQIDDIVINHEHGISGKDKEKILLASDLFVLTSRFEGHPMALVEALSYGIPVLISRGTNMYDEVKEYDAGWVCEISKESIRNALYQVISEATTLSKKSINARELASLYDWDILAEKLHSILQRNLLF